MRNLLLALSLAAAAAPAGALLPDEENTIKVFKEAAGSVVSVTNIAVGHDMYMDEMAVPQGTGSGFVWDREGHIVTNFHVVRGGDAFLIRRRLPDHAQGSDAARSQGRGRRAAKGHRRAQGD
jgi:S1-C subfamily serine protease